MRTALLLVAATMATAVPSPGQLRIIPQQRIDSVVHPATAPGGEAMRFARTTIDAGRLDEEQTPPSFVFRWTNAGDQPLVVTKVVTTCGCAVPSYDRRPVEAGDSSRITVTYRPKGHPGVFARRIFVYTQLSAKNPTAILELKGEVVPTRQTAEGYPVSMGALQLSRRIVRFDGRGGRQEARIFCRNAGSEALRIGYDAPLLPKEFGFECAPEELAPGEEGVLTVRYEPPEGVRTRQYPLRLTGLRLPPSQSTIRIQIEME